MTREDYEPNCVHSVGHRIWPNRRKQARLEQQSRPAPATPTAEQAINAALKRKLRK
jgi:hypothetical protein